MTTRRSLTIDGDRLDEGVRQLAAVFADRLDPRHERDQLLDDVVRRYDELPPDHVAWTAASDLLTMDDCASQLSSHKDDAADIQRAMAHLVSAVWDAVSGDSVASDDRMARAWRAVAIATSLLVELMDARIKALRDPAWAMDFEVPELLERLGRVLPEPSK